MPPEIQEITTYPRKIFVVIDSVEYTVNRSNYHAWLEKTGKFQQHLVEFMQEENILETSNPFVCQ